MSNSDLFVAPSANVVVPTTRMVGTIDELRALAFWATGRYRFFSCEVVRGSVQIRFINDNPAAEREVGG